MEGVPEGTARTRRRLPRPRMIALGAMTADYLIFRPGQGVLAGRPHLTPALR